MNITFPVKLTTILIPLAAGSCINSQDKDDTKPNIIIIYTDDVGYGDISSYGATLVNTPNVDKLASNGLKFTNAYAASATCTPSRYALLTGEYYWRKPPGWRVGDLEGTSIAPGDAGMIIETGIPTLASILK
jgi:arylsulfatase A-like enzyme